MNNNRLQPNLIIVGTMALDDIQTPFGKKEGVLGGSGSYAGLAASFFTKPGIVSIIGDDFPNQYLAILKSKGLNTDGITKSGKTFHWSGSYEYDMNEAKTRQTDLNSLATFRPKLPQSYKDAKFLFLANIDPDLQISVIGQMKGKAFILLDTMNFWITNKKDALVKAIKRVDALVLNDAEARQLTGMANLITAGRRLLELGPQYVIIKKGEHGSLMFSARTHFSAPSYPLEDLRDPTGAGDSFAGGMIGYLSSQNKTDEGTIRKAMIYGSAVASFCAEGFSVERLVSISKKEVKERYGVFEKIKEF